MFGNSNKNTTNSGGMFGNASSNNAGAFGSSSSGNTGGLFGAKPAVNTSNSGGMFGNNASSNTGGNSGGLFGNANAPGNTNTGGMFGNNSGNTNTNQSGGLFGANTNTGNTQSQGLFGGNTANTNNQSGGLFGGNASNNQSKGLFGGSSTNTNTNTQPGGLFGGNSGTTQSGGLFGANSNNTQSGGLFGGGNTTNNNAQSGGGLFGNANKPAQGGFLGSNNPSGNTGGLFGGNNTNANTTTGGLFGNNTNNNAGGLFNSNNNNNSLLGNNAPANNPINASQPQITSLTRVTDLPDAYQKEIEQLDQYIQQQMDIAESLKDDQTNHKELIESVPRDINFLENKYSSVNQAIHNDLNFVMSFKCKVLESFNDWVEKVIKLYLQLTNPVLLKEITNNDKTLNIKEAEPPNSAILHTFYVYKVKEIQQNIQKYHSVLQEIENAVDELDKVSSNGIDNSWDLVIQTLKEEFRLYLELANNLADVHHEIKRISV
ncbi:BA75_00459T0 [Komagataella pastoris]|uniref:BA75_00459T0 n=1 Tax=Komagataella pastoris TaxID=4922 RepID=A0A1B2J7Y8_PICPA|nr:BA75_00459T0 [Komagataella pastoris]